jgi:N-acetylneuraminate lyase
MKKLGVDCGPSRYPHPTLKDSEIKNAFETFENIGLSEYFSS